LALAGLCSGLTEAVVVNPFENVKVRLQTEQGKYSEVCSYNKDNNLKHIDKALF
jgi:hypothetical protein